MKGLREKLERYISGIYGGDALNIILVTICILLALVNVFVKSYIILAVEFLIIVAAFLRALSRKFERREKENNALLGFFRRISEFFRLTRFKFRDRKTHVYRKCPDCRAVIRLPKKKGKHTVVCPRCGAKFGVSV